MGCIACQNENVRTVVPFGTHAITRYYPSSNETKALEVCCLDIGYCSKCDQIQLVDNKRTNNKSSDEMHNEPEDHLNSLVQVVRANGVPKNILCLSYKDISTANRIQKYGTASIKTMEEATTNRYSQSNFNSIFEKNYKKRDLEEKYELIIARHILEHLENPLDFLKNMYDILKEDGRLIIEVPDSSKFLEIGDCAFVWEEHLTYHTPHTLKSLLERANLDASKQLIYEYLYEDSLIIIAQKKRLMEHEMATKCNNSKHILEEFKTSIEKRTNEIHNYLDKQDSRIAIFGAGHQAIRFIHLNGLHGKIKAVIDDNPIKIGKFIPGTSIPIVSSRQLKEFDICLLALSPESETRVRKKYNEYERNGGIFKSIFRLNRNSLV